ncbi:MAG: type II toxin-antitoxin system RelE/ParE family toxin [Lachnospiraceae bacterium]|jgi:phage-related protein|nr:type II toxin-antitoxin system RelE/ParE family toxin [Lachnospiraceae bacterium]
MYTVEFYETQNGECQIWDFLEGLRIKAVSNKDARIQHKQVSLCIELLQQNGTHMNENITKHLEDGIWELRPGNNRVFYFFFKNDTFVLLHQFRKKSQKTPKREIEKAKRERNDYLSRKENGKL